MTRFLIYLFPALIDMVLGSVIFVCGQRLVASGAPLWILTAVIPAWAGTYVVASLILGRIVNSHNCARFVLTGCLFLGVISFGFSLCDNFIGMFALVLGMAVSTSLFFLPFQIFMKQVEHGHGGAPNLVRSISLYTLSWSLGIAAGPFIAGFIYGHLGWEWCYRINVVFALAAAFGIWMLKHHAEHTPHEDPADIAAAKKTAPRLIDKFSKFPDLTWLGWICGGVCCAVVQIVFATFPEQGKRFVITTEQQGMIIATMYAMQGFVGLGLIFSRRWMYLPLKPVLFGLFGIAGLVLMGLGNNVWCFFLAAACIGVYSGSFFFYFVFHALVHPENAPRNISINEVIVGIAGVCGPVAAGQIGGHYGVAIPYYVVAGFVCATIIFQFATNMRMKSQVQLCLQNSGL
ncbi:MAG: MFS transporter [Phycisphaerae bacterium]|nr:MFS transporter [Phycisphaerae bacterium]